MFHNLWYIETHLNWYAHEWLSSAAAGAKEEDVHFLVVVEVVWNAPSKRLSAEAKCSSRARPTIFSLHHPLFTIQQGFSQLVDCICQRYPNIRKIGLVHQSLLDR
jgi:hypothetical protein